MSAAWQLDALSVFSITYYNIISVLCGLIVQFLYEKLLFKSI